MRLLSTLKALLDDFNLGIFKNISGEYRRGDMSAHAYYQGIKDLLQDNFKVSMFSNLQHRLYFSYGGHQPFLLYL